MGQGTQGLLVLCRIASGVFFKNVKGGAGNFPGCKSVVPRPGCVTQLQGYGRDFLCCGFALVRRKYEVVAFFGCVGWGFFCHIRLVTASRTMLSLEAFVPGVLKVRVDEPSSELGHEI